ncbi:MAG TPA: methyltransferase domain-containing protein, partial [Vicinamibacteria bacterium]
MATTKMNPERAVKSRYSRAAAEQERALCCPVDYDPRYLSVIPDEILERDYGCGDPSKHLHAGETVLDLGSGGGKICYIASQVVGPEGRVIGVDMNDDMLSLARKYRQSVGDLLGYHNVEFRKGKIQDLALDQERLEAHLESHPVRTVEELAAVGLWQEKERRENPMIPTASIDVVVSNCVLNLVEPESKTQLFREMHRVLKKGGRVVISDIVSDEDMPEHLQADPDLWSGCISGAFREDLFLKAFEDAGFYGIEILGRDDKPWQIVEGIEFRALTVRAFKGKEGPCLERNQAVIY